MICRNDHLFVWRVNNVVIQGSATRLGRVESGLTNRHTLMSQVKHWGRDLSTSQQALRRSVSGWIVQRRRRGPKTTVIKL